MTTIAPGTSLHTQCSCARVYGEPDTIAERIAALVANGVDQWTASWAVTAPHMLAAPVAEPVTDWTGWVRTRLLARLPWLRDEAGRADWSLPVALVCAVGVVVAIVGSVAR